MCLLLAALLLALSSHAQTLKEFFTTGAPLTYLGVDFTQARLLGDADAVPTDIRDRHFPAINNVIIAEPKKYDIAGAFRSQVTTDLSAVTKRNAAINPDRIKSNSSTDYRHLEPADIGKLVQGFDFGGKKGIGLLLVMDGMSKAEKAATIHIALVDMDSKEVLLTEALEGKAQGFGFRNYWAYTVHKVLEEVEKRRYRQWKAKYAK